MMRPVPAGASSSGMSNFQAKREKGAHDGWLHSPTPPPGGPASPIKLLLQLRHKTSRFTSSSFSYQTPEFRCTQKDEEYKKRQGKWADLKDRYEIPTTCPIRTPDNTVNKPMQSHSSSSQYLNLCSAASTAPQIQSRPITKGARDSFSEEKTRDTSKEINVLVLRDYLETAASRAIPSRAMTAGNCNSRNIRAKGHAEEKQFPVQHAGRPTTAPDPSKGNPYLHALSFKVREGDRSRGAATSGSVSGSWHYPEGYKPADGVRLDGVVKERNLPYKSLALSRQNSVAADAAEHGRPYTTSAPTANFWPMTGDTNGALEDGCKKIADVMAKSAFNLRDFGWNQDNWKTERGRLSNAEKDRLKQEREESLAIEDECMRNKEQNVQEEEKLGGIVTRRGNADILTLDDEPQHAAIVNKKSSTATSGALAAAMGDSNSGISTETGGGNPAATTTDIGTQETPQHSAVLQLGVAARPTLNLKDAPRVGVVGVGLIFRYYLDKHQYIVVRVVPNEAADRCGLVQKGDILMRVDKIILSKPEHWIQGEPINDIIYGAHGSSVTLTFRRGDSMGGEYAVSLVRGQNVNLAVVVPIKCDLSWKMELRKKWTARQENKELITSDEEVALRRVRLKTAEQIEEEKREVRTLYHQHLSLHASERRRLMNSGPPRYVDNLPFPDNFMRGYDSARAELDGLEQYSEGLQGPLAIRILEDDIRSKHNKNRWDIIAGHTDAIKNGLLESPGGKELRERLERRTARTNLRHEAEERALEAAFVASKTNQGGCSDGCGSGGGEEDLSNERCTRQRSVHAETSTESQVSGISQDSTFMLPSQQVTKVVDLMLQFPNKPDVQAAACTELANMIVPGGLDGPVGIGGGRLGGSGGGFGSYGAWTQAQAVVAEVGVVEVLLEMMRIHFHRALPNLRIAAVQLLGALALGNPVMRTRIGGAGGIQAIMLAMKFGVRADFSDLRDRNLISAGCLALRNCAVDHPGNIQIVDQERGIPLLLAAMKIFPEVPGVQQGAAGLLRMLAQSSEARQVAILQAGGDRVLRMHADFTRVFHIGQLVEARCAFDRKWYKANVMGRKGHLYIIKWTLGSWPELYSKQGDRGRDCGERREKEEGETQQRRHIPKPFLETPETDRPTDLLKDSVDLRLPQEEPKSHTKGSNTAWMRLREKGAARLVLGMATKLSVAAAARKTSDKGNVDKEEREREEDAFQKDDAIVHSDDEAEYLRDETMKIEKKLHHAFWHPRMPIKGPISMTVDRAVKRGEERAVIREKEKQEAKKNRDENIVNVKAGESMAIVAQGLLDESEVERERNEATIHFRRVDETVKSLAAAAMHATEQENVVDSPIRRMVKSLFSRMIKHEKHNPNYTHYHTSPLGR